MITAVHKKFDNYSGNILYKATAHNGYIFKFEFFKTIDEAYQWCADVSTWYEQEYCE